MDTLIAVLAVVGVCLFTGLVLVANYIIKNHPELLGDKAKNSPAP